MTVDAIFRKYISLFQQYGIADASDEARVLICHALNINSADFFAIPDMTLTDDEQSAVSALIERRLKGEPSAYIVGHKEFYGIDFYVDSRVLIPRPETEILVEELLAYSRRKAKQPLFIADVGTGSGAIAIALALNLATASVFAIDISAAALEVARCNVGRYGLERRVSLLQGDLLSPLAHPIDAVVANLPYVAERDLRALPLEISRYEPGIALNGGEEGTAMIDRLLKQVNGKVNRGGIVLLEISPGQEDKISKVVERIVPDAEIVLRDDLAGRKRVLEITSKDFDIDE